MRGSREISFASSLHRASTDALISLVIQPLKCCHWNGRSPGLAVCMSDKSETVSETSVTKQWRCFFCFVKWRKQMKEI